MANRLSVIATRTGDDGSTGLGDGSRTSKDALRIVALGDVDELNSVVWLLNAETLPAQVAKDLLAIQHDLFDIGAELCIPGHTALTDAHLARTTCRRAERAVVALARAEAVSALVRHYLNRLSDLMFVLARYLNRDLSVPDIFWSSAQSRPE